MTDRQLGHVKVTSDNSEGAPSSWLHEGQLNSSPTLGIRISDWQSEHLHVFPDAVPGAARHFEQFGHLKRSSRISRILDLPEMQFKNSGCWVKILQPNA